MREEPDDDSVEEMVPSSATEYGQITSVLPDKAR